MDVKHHVYLLTYGRNTCATHASLADDITDTDTHTLSLCLSLSLSLSVTLSLSLCLSVSVSVSVCLSLSLSLSLSGCVSVCLSVCLSVSQCDVCLKVLVASIEDDDDQKTGVPMLRSSLKILPQIGSGPRG